jgi:hypothetical protein
MTLTSRSGPWLGLSLILLTLACGGPEEPVPPPAAPKPLLTLEGQLTSGHPVEGPVRLALAWYPGMLREDEAGLPLSQPRAIVTNHPGR